jgi:hypothetical protein
VAAPNTSCGNLRRVCSDLSIVAIDSKRGQSLIASSGKCVFGGMNLRFRRFNIRTTFKGLLERVLKAEIGRSQEGHVIGKIVFVAWRQSGHSGQNDLLLGHFVLERDDSLLLRKLFDFAPIDVDLRHQSHTSLLLSLLKESSRGVELRVRGLYSFLVAIT